MKKLPPLDRVVRLADFLLFMESGKMINYTLSTPFFPTFDYYLIKGYKVSINDTGKGPFQMTNAFMKDYYESGAKYGGQVVALSEALCNLNMKFANVPLYMLQCLYGFIERFADSTDDLYVFYDKYYMPYDGKPLSDQIKPRVKEYIEYYDNVKSYYLKEKA